MVKTRINHEIRNLDFIKPRRITLDSNFSKHSSSLVVLGSRVFAVGGNFNLEVVEEFHLSSETWTVVDTPPVVPRIYHSMISVPAELFSHLPGGCEGVE